MVFGRNYKTRYPSLFLGGVAGFVLTGVIYDNTVLGSLAYSLGVLGSFLLVGIDITVGIAIVLLVSRWRSAYAVLYETEIKYGRTQGSPTASHSWNQISAIEYSERIEKTGTMIHSFLPSLNNIGRLILQFDDAASLTFICAVAGSFYSVGNIDPGAVNVTIEDLKKIVLQCTLQTKERLGYSWEAKESVLDEKGFESGFFCKVT